VFIKHTIAKNNSSAIYGMVGNIPVEVAFEIFYKPFVHNVGMCKNIIFFLISILKQLKIDRLPVSSKNI
jgi:hypothetical protein